MEKLISIVIHSFNEEANIPVLVDLLRSIKVPDSEFEIIFVDDGSTDETLNIIKDYSSRYKELKYLSFSRNFGHQIALKAGIDYAKGDCVISMDADMQHLPAMIPELIQKWEQVFDIVYTKRQDDKRLPFFKRISSMFFYCVAWVNTPPLGAQYLSLIPRPLAAGRASFLREGCAQKRVLKPFNLSADYKCPPPF